jgi:hypothetical protein
MTKTPFANVSLDGGTAFAQGVRSVRTIEAEFAHERCVILLDSKEPTSKRFASGAPVLVEWGINPAPRRHFIGYVSHTEPLHRPGSTTERGGEALVQVVCVAPTWVTKDQGLATFRNVPATHAVKTVGESFRFGVSNVARSSRIEPTLHQGGRSGWEFMVDCARKAGFTLFARGLHLYCLDRKDLIQRGVTQAPWLVSTALGGTVTEMTPNLGATAPESEHAVREAHAVNPRTGTLIGLRNSGQTEKPVFAQVGAPPGFTKARTALPVADIGEAKSALGAEERLHRLAVTATLVGKSHPSARVGGVVVVQGYGKDADGYWYVSAATHTYEGPQRQEMTLRLARDSATASMSLPSVPTPVASAGRSARLVGGRWVL